MQPSFLPKRVAYRVSSYNYIYYSTTHEPAMPRLMNWLKLQIIMFELSICGKPNSRMTVEGILCCMGVGCPWRDLLTEFGDWNAIYR